MLSAFQSNAFQSNAFQIERNGIVPVTPTDTHDWATIDRHRKKLKHQAKLAEDRLYQKKPTITIDLPNEQRQAITNAISAEEVTKIMEQVRMKRILDDDDEALIWLFQ